MRPGPGVGTLLISFLFSPQFAAMVPLGRLGEPEGEAFSWSLGGSKAWERVPLVTRGVPLVAARNRVPRVQEEVHQVLPLLWM